MKIQFKYFHDSLHFVLVLARGREFFSVKFVQIPLKFTE